MTGVLGVKYFSVNMPVASSVTVIVQASDANEAEDLASYVGDLSDAEYFDFIPEQPEVLEIEHGEIPKGARIWSSRTKYEIK